MSDLSNMDILVQIQRDQLQASIYRHLLAYHEQGVTAEQFCDFFTKLSKLDMMGQASQTI